MCSLAAGVLAASALASDNFDIEVYRDYPIGLWTMSVTSGNLQTTTATQHSDLSSLSVNLNADGQLRFNYNWGQYPTESFTVFEVWIQSNTGDVSNVTLKATTDAGVGSRLRLGNYTTFQPGQWTLVRIPTSDLGLSSADHVASFDFEAANSAVSFYADDIKIVRDQGANEPTIRVKPTNVIRENLPSTLWGVAVSANDATLTDPGTVALLQEGGLTSLSFPGGSLANVYDWQTGSNIQTGTGGLVMTDQFVQVSNAVGADKIVTVNYGSGTPEIAAAWVQYANIVLNGNVMYWAIGNEPWGWWEYDLNDPPHDADTYAAFVRDSYTLMKAVDPRIKIGIAGCTNQYDYPQASSVINPRTGQSVNGWSAVLLTRLREYGIVPDFYDYHFYLYGPFQENDSFLMSSDLWSLTLPIVRLLLTDYLGTAGSTVPIFIGETNSTSYAPGKQSTGLVNGLFLADSWGKAVTIGAGSFTWWILHAPTNPNFNNSPTLYGWRNYGDYGIASWGIPEGVSPPLNTKYPTFYAFKMLKYFARPGDSLVQANSDNGLLGVYAATNPATGSVKILVINRARAQDITANFMLKGYTIPPTVRIRRYGMAEDQASSDISSIPRMSSSSLRRMTFPRYSMTLLEF